MMKWQQEIADNLILTVITYAFLRRGMQEEILAEDHRT